MIQTIISDFGLYVNENYGEHENSKGNNLMYNLLTFFSICGIIKKTLHL